MCVRVYFVFLPRKLLRLTVEGKASTFGPLLFGGQLVFGGLVVHLAFGPLPGSCLLIYHLGSPLWLCWFGRLNQDVIDVWRGVLFCVTSVSFSVSLLLFGGGRVVGVIDGCFT